MLLWMKVDCFGMEPSVMESAWRHFVAWRDRPTMEHASSILRRSWPCRKQCPSPARVPLKIDHNLLFTVSLGLNP